MNPGKRFENNWKISMQKEGLWCLRIRDNAMSYMESESIFSLENPYDFLCFRAPNLLCWELKHTEQSSMSIQTLESESDRKMIKYHQVKSLKEANNYDSVYAGFILSFYNKKIDTESTFYLSIDNFLRFIENEDKKSINMIDIAKYGGIRISQSLLRVNYHYHINDLIDKITNKDRS